MAPHIQPPVHLNLIPPPSPTQPTSSCLCSHCHHPPSCQTHNLGFSHPTSNPSTSLAWSTFKGDFKFTTTYYPTQTSIHPHRDQCEQPPPISWLLPHPSAVHSPPAARARPLKLSRSLPGLFKSPSSPGPRRRCRTCCLPSPAHFLLLEDLGWVPSRHILLPAAP